MPVSQPNFRVLSHTSLKVYRRQQIDLLPSHSLDSSRIIQSPPELPAASNGNEAFCSWCAGQGRKELAGVQPGLGHFKARAWRERAL